MEYNKAHWRRWYFVIILALALQIILYYCFTYYYK